MKKIFLSFCVVAIFASCSTSHPDVDDSLPKVDAYQPEVLDSSEIVFPSAPSSEVALNPPHGQPGHDCGIEVGAPLNAKPGIKNLPSAPASMSMPTNMRLNPPHGEPGHDCNYQVGSPLP